MYTELSDNISKPTYLAGVLQNATPRFSFLLGKNFYECRMENNYLKE